jgi:Zn-dependent peptidase ImmA (M78 family)
MAEEIRRTGKLTGPAQGLQFQLNLDPGDMQGLAWGECLVLLDGEPVWFSEDGEGQDIPLQWTWVDLLEYLGRWWPWLTLEQDYPFPFQPLYPGTLIQEAELRWQELPEEQAEEEEQEVHGFLARHDLAEGMKGIFLPSLVLVRQGNTCHVSAARKQHRVLPWPEVQRTLDEVGRFLAEAVSSSSNPRARHALDLWRKRDDRSSELELDLTTGLSVEARKSFQGLDWQCMEIRAVARMSSKTVLPAEQEELLRRVAALPCQETSELDGLAAQIQAEFQEIGPPHKQGYWAASRLRGLLKLSRNEYVEPKNFLEHWGILIQKIQMERCPVEAVTAWGKDHGPAIILNTGAGSRAGHEFGQRATLAHEIAHLILDRDRALPAGEVLGGRTPEYLEKRARAFAAELLLPRDSAEEVVRNSASLEDAARHLQKTYKVSTEMLAWQINNSRARNFLSPEDHTRLEHWKTGRAELGSRE